MEDAVGTLVASVRRAEPWRRGLKQRLLIRSRRLGALVRATTGHEYLARGAGRAASEVTVRISPVKARPEYRRGLRPGHICAFGNTGSVYIALEDVATGAALALDEIGPAILFRADGPGFVAVHSRGEWVAAADTRVLQLRGRGGNGPGLGALTAWLHASLVAWLIAGGVELEDLPVRASGIELELDAITSAARDARTGWARPTELARVEAERLAGDREVRRLREKIEDLVFEAYRVTPFERALILADLR